MRPRTHHEEIISYLRRNQSASAADLVSATFLSSNVVRQILMDLAREGTIELDGTGLWTVHEEKTAWLDFIED